MKRLLASLLCFIMLLLPCVEYAEATGQTKTEIEKQTILAALFEADLSALRLAIDEGLITSTELTQYYLDRIEKYDEPFNCFITLCEDALQIASERDEQIAKGEGKGLLFGIPIVVKDNMDLEGVHTTNGLKKDEKQIADSNADVVEYLLSEGAVIIAKANMSTEAQNALRSYSQAAGETKNAYNRYLAAGGSSGGSAVSTSLNFTAASLGTDTNSSLRVPAALAGCVSLRPTFGMISVKGIKKLNSTRDVPGAITRTVYDQAIMLDVLTQGKFDYAENLNENALQGMRIGVLKQLSYATTKTGLRKEENIDTEVVEAFNNAISELKQCGAEVVDVSMSDLFSLSDKTFQNNKAASKEALYESFQELLKDENISAVIYPTYLSTPIRSGRDADGKYWDVYKQVNINNCRTLSPSAGVPEITVPIGVHSLGAGIGMEITSTKNSEQLLLDIAYSYTNRFDHRQVPAGAPNDHSEFYMGTIPELIALRNQPVVPEQPNGDRAPQESTAMTSPVTAEAVTKVKVWPFVLLGILILVLVCVIIEIRNRRIRRRKRRERMQRRQTMQ